jgi:hypothetical protein
MQFLNECSFKHLHRLDLLLIQQPFSLLPLNLFLILLSPPLRQYPRLFLFPLLSSILLLLYNPMPLQDVLTLEESLLCEPFLKCSLLISDCLSDHARLCLYLLTHPVPCSLLSLPTFLCPLVVQSFFFFKLGTLGLQLKLQKLLLLLYLRLLKDFVFNLLLMGENAVGG